MPALKYKASRDLPAFVRDAKTFSPVDLAKIILDKRNEVVSPQSISMYFARHKDLEAQLKTEVVQDQIDNTIVDPSIFQNGTFEKLPSIQNWLKQMTLRELSPGVITGAIGAVKRVCQGKFTTLKIDFHESGTWSYKHPDRLTIEDAQDLLFQLMKLDHNTSTLRLPLRNFFESKGLVVGQAISGAKSKGFGKFADLYVTMPKLVAVLEIVKSESFQAYVADMFMLRYGPRITATLDLKIEDLNKQEKTLRGLDKGRHSKGRKPFRKYLDQAMIDLFAQVIGDRQAGKIFNVQEHEMSVLNRRALTQVMPELAPKIEMPNHFWRHMFAQHMLRRTNWNYAKVASLGNWTIGALQESYGQPPQEIVEQWGKEATIDLTVS